MSLPDGLMDLYQFNKSRYYAAAPIIEGPSEPTYPITAGISGTYRFIRHDINHYREEPKPHEIWGLQIQKAGEVYFVRTSFLNEPTNKSMFERKLKSPNKVQDFIGLVEEINNIWDTIPEEEMEKIPEDASERLDKYLYGNEE